MKVINLIIYGYLMKETSASEISWTYYIHLGNVSLSSIMADTYIRPL